MKIKMVFILLLPLLILSAGSFAQQEEPSQDEQLVRSETLIFHNVQRTPFYEEQSHPNNGQCESMMQEQECEYNAIRANVLTQSPLSCIEKKRELRSIIDRVISEENLEEMSALSLKLKTQLENYEQSCDF